MKKILIVLSSLFLFLSFSKPVEKLDVTGNITRCGNDPFFYPVFVSKDGKSYGINASDEVLNELLASGPKTISVTGTVIPKPKNYNSPNGGKDGILQLDDWKYIE